MVRKSIKKKGNETPLPKPKKKKRSNNEVAAIVKLAVLLCLIGAAVAIGAFFHEKQIKQPVGYEYFKKRGYDKIKDLGPPPEEPPKTTLEEDLEDAKIKAQRNIFLQD